MAVKHKYKTHLSPHSASKPPLVTNYSAQLRRLRLASSAAVPACTDLLELVRQATKFPWREMTMAAVAVSIFWFLHLHRLMLCI